MKVKLATQTISNSVADAIEFLKKIGHPDFQDADGTIRFIRKMNNLFDLLNSRNPFGRGCHTPLKAANKLYWRPILLDAVEYLKQLKTADQKLIYSTPKQTPIKGLVITIQSLLGMYEKYVEQQNAPLSYLLTYKFSQDHLELFFCSIRARNGWNNNPSAFQFYSTYKRLLVRHDLRAIEGNCTTQDKTHLLAVVPSTSTRKICNVSMDDVSFIKKYGLDWSEVEIADHDYTIPQLPVLSALTENVVGYIAGYVVKMMRRQIKCQECLEILYTVPSSTSHTHSALLLVEQKDRGGLIKPSNDLLQLLLVVEKCIKQVLFICDQKLPNDEGFFNTFCHTVAMKLFSEDKYFKSLAGHILDWSLLEENHIMRLIKAAVSSFTKIRLHHVARQQTDRERGEQIRQKLSKLILFHHQ